MHDVDAGLLLLRIVFGAVIIGHGLRKLLGWFGGPGRNESAAMFDSIGYRPGRLLVTVASVSEVVGGLLLITGALWPIGPMITVGTMLVAASTHRAQGFWASQGGGELPFAYAVVSAGLLLAGPGAAAVESKAGLDLTLPLRTIALAAAIGGALSLMGYRQYRVRRDGPRSAVR